MTEQEWLVSVEPAAMQEFLRLRAGAAFVHEPWSRKLRLFAVACCRQVWGAITDERARRAIEVAERYADGMATAEELESAYAPCRHAANPNLWYGSAVCRNDPSRLLGFLETRRQNDSLAQSSLLRCLFGNPFRPQFRDRLIQCGRCWGHAPAGVGCGHVPNLFTWQGGIVVRMAETIYQTRDFSGMGPLADALEEAGCPETEECPICGGSGGAILHLVASGVWSGACHPCGALAACRILGWLT